MMPLALPPLSGPRPRASTRARLSAFACASGLLAGCYSDSYLDGLCARTNSCPISRVAFHITSLELVDPHSYTFDASLGVCDDSTDDFNKLVSTNVADFSVGHAIVVRPLDLGSETVKFQFVAADCFKDEMTDGSTVCSDRNTAVSLNTNTSATNFTAAMMAASDACDIAEVNSLNPTYVAPSLPDLPCLRSAPIPAMTLRLSQQTGMTPLDFELADVEIAATYSVDAEPQRLLKGTLKGFMTSAKAMVAAGTVNNVDFVPWNVLAGGLGCQPDANNVISDLDIHPTLGQGVWMYFNFSAESVKWDTDVPDGTPETSSGSDGGTSSTGTTGDGTTTTTTTTTTTDPTGATTVATVGTSL